MNNLLFSGLLCSFILSLTASSESPVALVENLVEDQEEGELWAVLVAGSYEWHNYRHQADVCHSYQVLKNHGIPDERIIVMMYDDIAGSNENPTPGKIINHPNGPDVYKGVPHDYTGALGVTPKNFMAVLKGDKKALVGKGSGKVLESGPKDHVFIYFADHGATGIISFPHEHLAARDLNQTIAYMYENQKYGKMVIYMEACESGSMFKNILPTNINVFATTSANEIESSFSCYHDNLRNTFLGDFYSVNWLEDSDKKILTQETLLEQYEIVKKETNMSHVQKFGNAGVSQMNVSEFQGRKKAESILLTYSKNLDLVRSRDVPIEIEKKKLISPYLLDEDKPKILEKLDKMLRNRAFLWDQVKAIVYEVTGNKDDETEILKEHYELKNYECYDEVREHFNNECFELSKNQYALDYMYVLVNLCERNIPKSNIKVAMGVVCVHPPVHGIV